MVAELLKDNFLNKRGRKTPKMIHFLEQNRAVVFFLGRLGQGCSFFLERTNTSYFKSCGKGTCAQGCVDDVSDGRKQVWKAVREEKCRNRVRFNFRDRMKARNTTASLWSHQPHVSHHDEVKLSYTHAEQ